MLTSGLMRNNTEITGAQGASGALILLHKERIKMLKRIIDLWLGALIIIGGGIIIFLILVLTVGTKQQTIETKTPCQLGKCRCGK